MEFNNWFNVQIIGPVRELTKTYGSERSPRWRKVRQEFLEMNPCCAVCGRKNLQSNVHHKIPFHIRPDLELEEDNLITLCRDHHFLFGHLGSWISFNATVETDVKEWNEKIRTRPKKTKERE
jgi:hypothetical protein